MQFFSSFSRYQQMAISFAVALLVSAGFALFIQGRNAGSPTEITAVASLSNAPGLLSTLARTGETKVSAEHDSDKGLTLTILDNNVKFIDYLSCLHKDYLKSYPKYPGILSQNNGCINKRMQHDILLQKLATAERSAGLAKEKADMIKEVLDYASAHEKDENVDLSILFLFKGIDDTAYYEKASFSPQCLIQGGEKSGPKFAGMLKPQGDSSSAFVDSTPVTQARKVQFLKEVEELYKKGEELSGGDITKFLAKNVFGIKWNIFEPAVMSLFIGVLPESAEKRGYKINDSLLKRSDVVGSMSLKFYKGACKNPKEVFRFNLGVSWNNKEISKAVSFPPGNLNTCITQKDKDDYLKKMKDAMTDNLNKLREIQAKYEKQARAYASDMKKLENGDPECFNLPAANVPATTGEEAKPPTAPVKSSYTPPPYQGYATAGDGETRAFEPGNANALCLYNATSGLSKSICDYYAEKRFDAQKLGVSILDSAFTDGGKREQMNGPEFLRLVVKPLYGYINSHPELNITHIAVAKDIPIRITDTEKYLAKGNDFMTSSPSKTVFASANFLLSIQGDYANATNISEYVFGSSVTDDNGCVALKPGLQSSRNLEYQKAPVKHFDPAVYKNRPYANNPRFAVSFLSGYSLLDIKNMIDKAQSPAPAKTNAAWVFDLDPSISLFSEEAALASKRKIMESAGAPQSAVFAYSAKTKGRPKEYALPIIGYWGMGVHNPGYGNFWIAENPVVRGLVAPRAILESLESWNGYTFQGNAMHTTQPAFAGNHGNIADSFASNAFGGANYSGSFSGAVGNVYEPTNVGTVHQEALFVNYAAGLTFGESVLKSFRYLPNSLYSVHIAVGDPLMRAFDEPISEGRIINFGGSGIDTSFDIPTTGGRKCYTQPSSCAAPDGTTIADGVGICADAARRQVCVNGAFSAQTKVCEKGCSLGSCVEDVFTPPNKLSLKKYQTYPLVIPIKTASNKINDIFRNPPDYTDAKYWIGSVTRSAIRTPNLGWGWGKGTDSLVPDPDILPGTGILFTPGEDYEATLTGQPFTSSVAVNIRWDTPIFGIPFCGDKYTASQALREVRTIEPRCTAIANMAKWANTYPSLYWGSAVSGAIESDFKLNNYESYYLVCEPAVNFVWKPSCNLSVASGVGAGNKPQEQASELLNRLKEMEEKINKLP